MSLVVDHPAEGPDFRVLAGQPAPAEVEYYFLLGRYIDTATLARASALAAQWGVHPHDVLIANGWLAADGYYRALAESCGTSFKPVLAPTETVPPGGTTPRQCLACGLLKERARSRHYVLAPERLRPNAVRAMLAQLAPYDFTLATPRAVREAVSHHFAPALAQAAVEGLAIRRPEQSARTRDGAVATRCSDRRRREPPRRPPAGADRHHPRGHAATRRAVRAGDRLACRGRLRAPARGREPRAVARRAACQMRRFPPTPSSCRSIARHTCCPRSFRRCRGSIGRPPSSTSSWSSRRWTKRPSPQRRALNLPGNVEIVVVPDCAPRTKPKALNYALPLARGEFLVIYDAEDRPERDQLRRAFDAFRSGPPNLATVQARLNIYNAGASWLTRQFTLEYSALFDGLLPRSTGSGCQSLSAAHPTISAWRRCDGSWRGTRSTLRRMRTSARGSRGVAIAAR